MCIAIISCSDSFLHKPFFSFLRFNRNLSQDKPSPPHIMIAGPPSVGKGSLCNIVGTRLGLVHISAGDIFRESIRARTKIGNQVANFVKNGRLVPDKITIDMIKERLAQNDCVQKGWLLDGFPRSMKQAMSLKQSGISVDTVIVLDAPPSIILQRGLGRCIDPVNGRVYHKIYNPPPSNILHRIIERPDDTKETLLRRYDEYKETIGNILQVYGNKVHIIDASRDMNVYIDEINSILDPLVKRWKNE